MEGKEGKAYFILVDYPALELLVPALVASFLFYNVVYREVV